MVSKHVLVQPSVLGIRVLGAQMSRTEGALGSRRGPGGLPGTVLGVPASVFRMFWGVRKGGC